MINDYISSGHGLLILNTYGSGCINQKSPCNAVSQNYMAVRLVISNAALYLVFMIRMIDLKNKETLIQAEAIMNCRIGVTVNTWPWLTAESCFTRVMPTSAMLLTLCCNLSRVLTSNLNTD